MGGCSFGGLVFGLEVGSGCGLWGFGEFFDRRGCYDGCTVRVMAILLDFVF